MGQAQGAETDQRIAELIAAGDYRQAIAACTRSHEATLTELCVSELGDNDDAREAVQEILVAAFDAMPTFDPKQTVETWLLGIAHHICARRAEANAPKPEPSELEKRVMAAVDARGPVSATKTPAPTSPTAAPATAATPAATPTAATTTVEKPPHQDIVVPTTDTKKPGLWIVAVAILALVAFVIGVTRKDEDKTTVVDAQGFDGALTGRISDVQRATADIGGVEISTSTNGEFGAVDNGAELGVGAAIRTDARTRAELLLSDGSTIHLDHNTLLSLDAKTPRAIRLEHGNLIAEMQHLADAPAATITTPSGRVEVVGTKFFLSAQATATNVRVTQGRVLLHSQDGTRSEVRPGEEAWLVATGSASVQPAVDIASSMHWTDDDQDDTQLRGLGELRARRPGEQSDKDRPLQLSSHKVDVKVAGNLARTEVEEVFSNDGPHELEGIYRFPLPPDAQIASLSLLVDGEWMEGGFVERDRAKKIWRGVIRNATPEQERQREEYIWVPGPWRDPALLEWQKGGQFELRIFPIPARGSRSVRIAYTEMLPAHGRGRRYTYPLPHSADPKLRVGRFDANVKMIGVDPEQSEQPTSYPMQRNQDGGSVALSFTEDGFSPAGDLTVDFRPHEADAELRSFAFDGRATAPPPASSREGDPAIQREHQALHGDSSAYVAFVVRPALPGAKTFLARDFVIVVDASQSMVGERFVRSSRLADRIVREMDPGDRVNVLACDSTCRAMSEGPEYASAALAERAHAWLSTVETAGGSDLVATMREAVAVGQRNRNARELHVVYIGDGSATTGHRRAASIANDVAALAASASTTFTTIGIGSDADSLVLSAVARAGGGHYLGYRPGESLTVVALRMLESTYGAALKNPWLELPAGIDRVAPGSLPTIRSGDEVVVVGRMRGREVNGDAVLRGELAGQPYEKRFPIRVQASSDLGNAFVPTLWAQKSIEKLELDGLGQDVPKIVALSKAFSVMSRHTSLLVLESEAMFKAFGVDRSSSAISWTGDEEADGDSADAMDAPGDGLAEAANAYEVGSTGALQGLATGGGGMGTGSLNRMAGGSGSGRSEGSSSAGPPPRPTSAPAAASAPRARSAPMEAELAMADDEAPARKAESRAPPMPEPMPLEIEERRRPMPLPPTPRGQWMRKVWFKVATISSNASPGSSDTQAVATAQSELDARPDSRDRQRALVRALAKAGELERAATAASDWLERDKLDPEALTYLSDVIGRGGDRDRALRLLSGVVDLRADDAVLHERMAKAFERTGNAVRACAHRVSLAEIKADSVNDVAKALRCERALGHSTGARSLIDGLKDNALRSKVESAAERNDNPARARGELLLVGRWSAPVDLDLSLVTSEGTRVSWMGGRVSAVGEDADSLGRETVGLSSVGAGSYRVEVSRTDPNDHRPISGQVEVRALDERQTLRFNLVGTHAVIGSVRIKRESRLVPSSAPRR